MKDDRAKGMQAMLYQYDQLNRITEAPSLSSYTAGSGFASRNAGPAAYDVHYRYDANGNLLDLKDGVHIRWTPYGKIREVLTVD